MCLAVPLQIVELNGATAVVEADGIRCEAVVAFIENPRVGDHVLVHAGFAIRKWSEADLREYREILATASSAPAAASPERPAEAQGA